MEKIVLFVHNISLLEQGMEGCCQWLYKSGLRPSPTVAVFRSPLIIAAIANTNTLKTRLNIID